MHHHGAVSYFLLLDDIELVLGIITQYTEFHNALFQHCSEQWHVKRVHMCIKNIKLHYSYLKDCITCLFLFRLRIFYVHNAKWSFLATFIFFLKVGLFGF